MARIDAALADRIQRLHDAIASQSAADPGVGTCLLHGDVGWRNLYTDSGDYAHLILRKLEKGE